MTRIPVTIHDQPRVPRPDSRWGPVDASSTQLEATFDLIVVGAGLSGLASAHYYQQRFGSRSNIMIIDAADYIGGMARQIQFDVDGTVLVTNGGAAALNGTKSWETPINRRFFARLGIDTSASRSSSNERLTGAGLESSTFFDRDSFGRDVLVRGSWPTGGTQPASPDSVRSWVRQLPLSVNQRDSLTKLWTNHDVPAQDEQQTARREYLAHTSYRSYLLTDWQVDERAVDLFTRRTIGTFGSPASCVPALEAMRIGLPGFAGLTAAGEHRYPWIDEPEISFPGGLAAIADKAVELISAQGPVRFQLESTVVGLQNVAADSVLVDYLRKGRRYRTRARHCVFAGPAQTLPEILPELGPDQRAGLERVVKPPMCYVKVALRDWRAFAEIGIHDSFCPGAFFYKIELEAAGPDADRPAVALLCHRPVIDPAEEDYRREAKAAQAAMLAVSATDYASAVHDQLRRLLARAGFDPERTIAGITVNRWPFTYSPTINTLTDEPSAFERELNRTRHPVGNIAVAGVDSQRFGWAQAAIDAAERAVHELPTGAPQMSF